MLRRTIATPALVSTAWLSTNLNNVRVVDASWYLPNMNRNARAEFNERRIIGATFYDVDSTDDTSGLPHMIPSEAFFSSSMQALNIGNHDHVVAYDGKGIFSAGRLWWLLKAFGHEKASVLDGGLPKWINENLPTESGPPRPTNAGASFKATLQTGRVCSKDKVKALVDGAPSDGVPVVDARPLGRFEGTVAEARPGCRSGHIPGSRCVPFTAVLAEDGATMKSPEAIRAVFEAAGVDPMNPDLIGSCGSGVTACVLALGLAHAGRSDLLEVYDGSWAEWGGDHSLPLETGAAPGRVLSKKRERDRE